MMSFLCIVWNAKKDKEKMHSSSIEDVRGKQIFVANFAILESL